MFYYVYVLHCVKGEIISFYVGYCRDLKERLKRHLTGDIKTTKKFDQIKLVYFEACLNKSDATRRERQLKTGFGRGYLKRRLQRYFNKRE